MPIEQARHFQLLSWLIIVFLSACSSVVVNSVSVPSSFELKDGGGPLVLGCDFSVDAHETGFVLQWLQNSVVIYQWIPSKKVPFALRRFKGRLDLEYATSEDRYKKHSSLVITKPQLSDSGNYTCVVQTYQRKDGKSVDMLVYDPADSIGLTYSIDEAKDEVTVKCEVRKIGPLPDVKLLFNNEKRDVPTNIHTRRHGDDTENKQYDATISATFPKNKIQDKTSITCLVKIENSDYEKTETVTFVDPVQTAISDNVDEVTEADQPKDYSVTTNSSSEVGDSTVGEV